MKRCSKCRETKSLIEFHNDKTKRDGKTSTCKECARERARIYHTVNAEACNAKKRAYQVVNADTLRARKEAYYAANPDKAEALKAWRRGYHAAYYATNREAIVSREIEWAQNNIELVRATRQRYRASKRAATVEHFAQSDLCEYWIDNGIDPDTCIYCGGPHEHDDHVIPLSRGGTHERVNLVPACARCNCSKSNKLIEEWKGSAF